MLVNKRFPIQFQWVYNPDSFSKSFVGTLYIGAKEDVSLELIANLTNAKLASLENELKCKIEDIIKDELRNFLKEETK